MDINLSIKILVLGVSICFLAMPILGFQQEDLDKLHRTNECIRCDLSGANLRSANLSRANLRSSNLSGPNLRGASLDEVDLSFANLNGKCSCSSLGRFLYISLFKLQSKSMENAR